MVSASKLILGCGNFGGVGSSPELYGAGDAEAQARVLLAAALDCGIRAFDTAHSYGGGSSEAYLGRWLQSLPASTRGSLTVATKIGNPHGAFPGRRPLEAGEVERQLGISLTRLKRDAADVLYLHEPDRATPWAETFAALERAYDRGQFRHLALSNVSLPDAAAALAAAGARLRPLVRYVQNEFHLLQPQDREALIPFLRARGIAYVAFSPLAGGLLSGKYRRGHAPPAGSRLALRPQPYLRYLSDEAFARIDELAAEARRHGEPLPAAALRFALANGHADLAVIGPRRIEHLRSLFAGIRPKPSTAADLPATV